MTTNLVLAEVSAPLATRSEQLKAHMETLLAERAIMGEFVRKVMVEGEDYGIIPGAGDRKVLLKPGAEKILDLFRCTARYTFVERIEDFDRGFFHYLLKCEVTQRDVDQLIAEGMGSCNSNESKYRYRNAQRTCPSCGKAAIIKGKVEYGGGFICFAKKGGCGAKFTDGAPEIESQQIGQIENPDRADQANTILKMGKKRALVDAALQVGRCSDVFTQDQEDEIGVVDEKTGEVVQTDAVAAYSKRVQATKTEADLQAIGTELKASSLSLQTKNVLRGVFSARMAQFQHNRGVAAAVSAKAKVMAQVKSPRPPEPEQPAPVPEDTRETGADFSPEELAEMQAEMEKDRAAEKPPEGA